MSGVSDCEGGVRGVSECEECVSGASECEECVWVVGVSAKSL